MFAGLSLDQAPPFEAPLQFLLLAPLFGIIAGVMIFFGGNQSVALHFLTIGYMVLAIFGALQQMVPVVAGVVHKNPLFLSRFTLATILCGVIGFWYGFYYDDRFGYGGAILFLSAGILYFVTKNIFALLRIDTKTLIIKGIIYSLSFFALALLLGVLILLIYMQTDPIVRYELLLVLHPIIIFYGTFFILISAISFQVVPMFWVTTPYGKTTQQQIVYGTIFSIVGIGIALIIGLDPMVMILLKILLLLPLGIYGVATYKKLTTRKRKLQDATVSFWLIGLVFLALGILSVVFESFIYQDSKVSYLFFGGFILSIINGMSYKIIPFLTWFHLTSKGIAGVPSMREMLSSKLVTLQKWLHTLAISSSVIDLRVGGFLFACSNLLFLYLILKVVWVYNKAR